MQEELNRVKKTLRKVEMSEVHQAPSFLCTLDTKQEQDQYQRLMLKSNIENWYSHIEGITFKTEFIPLSIYDAQMFVKVCELIQAEKQAMAVYQTGFDQLLALVRQKRGAEVADWLIALEMRLQPAIENFVRKSGGVFVKLSSRSAKDAGIYDETMKHRYNLCLKLLKNSASHEQNCQTWGKNTWEVNQKLRALLMAGTVVLKMKSAKQVLQMFLQSERVLQDMLLALDQEKHGYVMNFILREWVDLDPLLEFRAYVHEGKLCAISQYCHLVYHEEINKNKDRISEKIIQFFNENVAECMHACFGIDSSYVVDFVLILPDNQNFEDATVMVIEVNPFFSTTDGCLFSWKDEAHLLMEGNAVFRVREFPAASAKSLVSIEWRQLLNDAETV